MTSHHHTPMIHGPSKSYNHRIYTMSIRLNGYLRVRNRHHYHDDQLCALMLNFFFYFYASRFLSLQKHFCKTLMSKKAGDNWDHGVKPYREVELAPVVGALLLRVALQPAAPAHHKAIPPRLATVVAMVTRLVAVEAQAVGAAVTAVALAPAQKAVGALLHTQNTACIEVSKTVWGSSAYTKHCLH